MRDHLQKSVPSSVNVIKDQDGGVLTDWGGSGNMTIIKIGGGILEQEKNIADEVW